MYRIYCLLFDLWNVAYKNKSFTSSCTLVIAHKVNTRYKSTYYQLSLLVGNKAPSSSFRQRSHLQTLRLRNKLSPLTKSRVPKALQVNKHLGLDLYVQAYCEDVAFHLNNVIVKMPTRLFKVKYHFAKKDYSQRKHLLVHVCSLLQKPNTCALTKHRQVTPLGFCPVMYPLSIWISITIWNFLWKFFYICLSERIIIVF